MTRWMLDICRSVPLSSFPKDFATTYRGSFLNCIFFFGGPIRNDDQPPVQQQQQQQQQQQHLTPIAFIQRHPTRLLPNFHPSTLCCCTVRRLWSSEPLFAMDSVLYRARRQLVTTVPHCVAKERWIKKLLVRDNNDNCVSYYPATNII